MATDDLDKLIQESEDALKRLDALQKKKPLLDRVKIHFQRNNAHLINILLAGSVLAVALGRLGQKHEYQVRRCTPGGRVSGVLKPGGGGMSTAAGGTARRWCCRLWQHSASTSQASTSQASTSQAQLHLSGWNADR